MNVGREKQKVEAKERSQVIGTESTEPPPAEVAAKIATADTSKTTDVKSDTSTNGESRGTPAGEPHREPLLAFQNVRCWFPIRRGVFSRTVGQVRAVDGVTLELGARETLGLVGESGCGKTTLARAAVQLAPLTSGTIHFRGSRINDPRNRSAAGRRAIQFIFQDPYSSLNPRMPVIQLVTEGMRVHGLVSRANRYNRARELLAAVGMEPDALYRYPHEFSGGQRQRISIARAISLEPELIICDEAVSALDVSVQAQVVNLLADLKERLGLSYLFISHDISVVRHVADRIAVMYLGHIVETGTADDVVAAPAHPYTRALISAVPRYDRAKAERIVLSGDVPSPAAPPPGCPFHPRCPYATEECRKALPELMPVAGRPGHQAACIRLDEISRIQV